MLDRCLFTLDATPKVQELAFINDLSRRSSSLILIQISSPSTGTLGEIKFLNHAYIMGTSTEIDDILIRDASPFSRPIGDT